MCKYFGFVIRIFRLLFRICLPTLGPVPDFRYPHFCPLARATEILAERWTLLILRELFCGPQRFSDLRRRLVGISTSVLTERLARLEERGLVGRRTLPAPAASQIYELREAGRALARPMGELMRWGLRWLEPNPEDHFEPEWFGLGLRFFALRRPLPVHRFRLIVDAADPEAPPALDWLVTTGNEGVAIAAVPPEGPAELVPEPELTVGGPALPLMGVVSRTLPARDLIAGGALRAEGDLDLLDVLPGCFDFSPDGPAEADRPGT
jgi:DNA-binding HxlR family transcriptional regulator